MQTKGDITEPYIVKKKCELHNGYTTLCESHIIPKFVYKWMKETGPGRFRQSSIKNKPINDGIKKKMLCKDCEDRFSKYEKRFNERVFKPYLKNNDIVIHNTSELKYFITSILWRIVKFYKDDGNPYRFKKELDKAEFEWRNFLLNNTPLINYRSLHFILIDSDYWMNKKTDLYFSRVVDMEIAESNTVCFVYAKFARFILIGEIKGFKEQDFKNTNIDFEKEFKNKNQILPNLNGFFESRIENVIDYDDLSDNQKKKNEIYYKGKRGRFENKDYMSIIKKYRE